MYQKRIKFVMIYIDEAHSSKWPIGLDSHPQPHASIEDRVDRAQAFVANHALDSRVFQCFVDTWSNAFAERFRGWPDVYYHVDKRYTVLTKSEYGEKADALIDVDCVDLIRVLLDKA
jgi:Iodothyronine deiodinase